MYFSFSPFEHFPFTSPALGGEPVRNITAFGMEKKMVVKPTNGCTRDYCYRKMTYTFKVAA